MLVYIYPLYLKLLLGMIFLLSALSVNCISSCFKNIPRSIWLLLLFVLALSVLIRSAFLPHIHRVYWDEYYHINLAQNILSSGNFYTCLSGDDISCEVAKASEWVPGFHVALSFVFQFFGDSADNAFLFNIGVSSLSIFVFFLLFQLIFNNPAYALIAAGVWSLVPAHLTFSTNASTDISSVFCILTVLLFWNIFLRKRSLRVFLLFIATLSYTVNTRIENVLLLVPLLIDLYHHRASLTQLSKRIGYGSGILIFISSLIPYLVMVWDIAFHQPTSTVWGMGMENKADLFIQNLFNNAFFFFNYSYSHIVLSVLSIFGLYVSYKRSKRFFVFYSYLFILFFLAYSSYFLVRISDATLPQFQQGVSFRFTLVLYISIIYFFISALDYMIGLKRVNNRIILPAVSLLFFINSFFHINLYRLHELEPLAKEYRFIVSVKDKLEQNLPIITMHAPCIISTLRRKAIELKTFFEIHKNGNYPEKIILYLGYWISYHPAYSENITNALSRLYEIEDIQRSGEYAFLVLKLRSNL
jgi:hypothetical protein